MLDRRIYRLVAIALAAAIGVGCAQTRVSTIEYLGWSEAIELHNGDTRVVVVPAIGRIMHYGPADGDNLIYTRPEFHGKQLEVGEVYRVDGEPAHLFFGGDRVLPTAEDRMEFVRGRRGLPDHYIDGSPYSYELHDDGVTIISPVSELLGVQLSRRIRLASTGSALTIDQTLAKHQPAARPDLDDLPLTIWNLTPIIPPLQTWQPMAEQSVFGRGFFVPRWSTNRVDGHYRIEDGLLQLTPHDGKSLKIGVDAPGWVASWDGERVMVERFEYLVDETYPEGGTSTAVYSNDRFTELECLSPEVALGVGESIEFTIVWELHPAADIGEAERVLRGF